MSEPCLRPFCNGTLSVSTALMILLALFGVSCAAETKESDLVETVLIRGATVSLGTPITNSRSKEYHEDEAPRQVKLNTFRIGKYPVTAEQFCLFLNSEHGVTHDPASLFFSGSERNHSSVRLSGGEFHPLRGFEKVPVNSVSWKGGVLFCAWLSEVTGRHFRLPSEAEWEMVARGIQGRPWPWGQCAPRAIHGERYTTPGDPHSVLPQHPVGSFPANTTPEGVCDMMGYIIGEWCAGKAGTDENTPDLLGTDMDVGDLVSKRPIRGMGSRMDSRPSTPRWLQPLLWETPYGSHPGRAWTRTWAPPVGWKGYVCGFRVVEVLKEEGVAGSRGDGSTLEY